MSMIRVTTPATEDILVSVGDIIDTLELDIPLDPDSRSTEQDKKYRTLDRIVKGASVAIESYIGRILRKQSYVERVAGQGNHNLLLYHRPVNSVESIRYGEFYGFSTESSTEDTTIEGSLLSTDYWSLLDQGAGLVYSPSAWSFTARYHIGLNDSILPNQPLPFLFSKVYGWL